MRLAPVLAVMAVAACTPPLVVQDVSFLVPLDQAKAFLPASVALPRAQFDRLHPLTVVDEPADLYAALAAVSVRADACFQEGSPVGPCQPQVRLVLQPVFDGASGPTTRDAAVHVFFEATEAEVVELVRGLAQLRARVGVTVSDELAAPHPGFGDARWVASAKEALGRLVSPARLRRVTSMSVHASNLAWIFSGADVAGDATVEFDVPTLPGTREHHVTSTGGKDAVEVTLDPGSPREPAVSELLAPGGLANATPEQRAALAAAVGRLEDPATHNPGTVDCAACHVAALAHRALASRGVSLPTPSAAPAAYDDTRNLRAFGFFFAEPSVSPRVLRESTLVRDDLSRRLER